VGITVNYKFIFCEDDKQENYKRKRGQRVKSAFDACVFFSLRIDAE
jgi:hypothetical protein